MDAEVLQSIAAFTSNAFDVFALYVTFTFSYLMVCYFVGEKLTNLQAIAVSLLYVFAAISTIISMVGNHQAIAAIIESNDTVLDSLLIWQMDYWMVGISALMVLGIFLSVYFMRYSMQRGT